MAAARHQGQEAHTWPDNCEHTRKKHKTYHWWPAEGVAARGSSPFLIRRARGACLKVIRDLRLRWEAGHWPRHGRCRCPCSDLPLPVLLSPPLLAPRQHLAAVAVAVAVAVEVVVLGTPSLGGGLAQPRQQRSRGELMAASQLFLRKFFVHSTLPLG